MAEVLEQSEPGGQSGLSVQDQRHQLAPAGVTRLAMIDVTWAHWGITPTASPRQRSSSRHESLLNILLGRRSSSPSGAREPGRPMAEPNAWISLEPQEKELKGRADSLRDRISSDPLLVRPWDWFAEKMKDFEGERSADHKDAVARDLFVRTDHADKTIRFIIEGLEQCELTANRAELRKVPGLLEAQMNLFACRVYLTPERAARLIHGPPGKDLAAPGHVMIDLRFREHRGRYWLYATFSVTTYEMYIPSYSWVPSGSGGPDSSLVDGLEALRDRYAYALRRSFQDHVHAFFPAAQVTILERKYQPPRFWVATGRDLTTAGVVFQDIISPNGHVVGQQDLLDTLLNVPGPDTVGLGVGDINGQARVFRRFLSSAERVHDRPVYLVLPFGFSSIVEDDLREMIQNLSDLEARAATRLFDIITDIDMYRSQLNLYEKIAGDGLALWDQIAMFLPVVRSPDLGKAHRLIELIHQIVLQGIADLEEEAANAQHTLEQVAEVEHDLTDQFDREFTEQPVPGCPSIRDSLIEAGYVGKARYAAQSLNEKSRQVRSIYQALMNSMSYAFDERRVRETDVLQWVALSFAIVLGVVSIWNEFLARYINGWQRVGPWVGSGAAFIVLAIVAVVVRRWRHSRLTSNHFKKDFEKLQKLLAAYSSDSLSRRLEVDEQESLRALVKDDKAPSEGGKIVTTAQEDALKSAEEYWHDFDLNLARKTAKFLDELTPPPPPGDFRSTQKLPKPDLEKLRERVEAWALRALLVTERPRNFYSSPLPLLTFLYRFFPIVSGKPSRETDWSAADSQVSDYDFRLTVVKHCGCAPENIPTLMRWGHWRVRDLPNASKFLVSKYVASVFVEELQKIGLRGNMDTERLRKMMEKMNRSVWNPKGFNPKEFKPAEPHSWGEQTVKELEAAQSLERDKFSQTVCGLAEASAQRRLTEYLLGVGTRVPTDCDLLRLGVEVRATAGGPLPADLQDAIWRLSAYQDLGPQSSVYPAGRTAPRAYGESDATTALHDAKIVFDYVKEWTHGALRSCSKNPASDLPE